MKPLDVTCIHCHARARLASTTVDGAKLELRSRGWLDFPRTADGQLAGMCPACRPSSSATAAGTTATGT